MKTILSIFIGVSLLILAIAFAIHLTMVGPAERAGQGISNFGKYAIDKAADAFSTVFQSQVHISSSATVCDATPIAELAVLQRRVNAVVCYTNMDEYGSSKIIIAQQGFIAKIGFDLGARSSASYDPSRRVLTIVLPQPKVLSFEDDGEPTYYVDESGILNKVTDDDRNQVLHLLKEEARASTDTTLAIGDAKQMIETRFYDLFRSFNVKVIVQFSNQPNMNERLLAPQM